MNELLLYIGLFLVSTFISSISQIMLKLSTKKQYSSHIAEYVNPLVISAYALFFGCTFLTMYALKVVPLSMAAILEASGYIFVTGLSGIFLHEKLNRRKILGLAVIIVGISVYSL